MIAWTPPWRGVDGKPPKLARCTTHPGRRPFRVVARTRDRQGRCAQCSRQGLVPAQTSLDVGA